MEEEQFSKKKKCTVFCGSRLYGPKSLPCWIQDPSLKNTIE